MDGPRVLIHFGFHKTGTSSAERTLLANKAALEDALIIVGRKTWPKVSGSAKSYSQNRRSDSLATLTRLAGRRMTQMDLGQRCLLISNVDLSGRLPGFPKIRDYGAVADIMQAMLDAVRQALGPATPVEFIASTRDRAGWIKSLYWQNLKVRRLTEDFDAFATRMQNFPTFETTLDGLRQRFPEVPLHVTDLESGKSDPLGPAGPLLQKAGVSPSRRASLAPTPPRKVSPDDDMQNQFLEINRSELSDTEVDRIKSDALAFMGSDGSDSV